MTPGSVTVRRKGAHTSGDRTALSLPASFQHVTVVCKQRAVTLEAVQSDSPNLWSNLRITITPAGTPIYWKQKPPVIPSLHSAKDIEMDCGIITSKTVLLLLSLIFWVSLRLERRYTSHLDSLGVAVGRKQGWHYFRSHPWLLTWILFLNHVW